MEKRQDLSLGTIILIISAFYLWQTMQLPKGDNFLNSSQSFPILIGSGLILLSVILIITGLFKNSTANEQRKLTKIQIKRAAIYLILTSLYIFLAIPVIGFIYSTIIFVAVLIIVSKEVKWYTGLIISGGTILTTYYLLHQLLKINFP